ncbi:MAG: hypothetical protein EXR27_14890, partial [Betaproteobacteria bacterium]|nr:hypothetical protein [Betaproteobacteria bacterium]
GSPPVALRAPSGEPGATPLPFDSFRIPQLLFQTRFNPKFVSRKIGGGSGAGDLHESLNMIGVGKLPVLLICENNGYQVSESWRTMRVQRGLSQYVAPHGFECAEIDGNDPFAVFDATLAARPRVAAGTPMLLDCFTYRMGGYSSHFGEPRRGNEAEMAEWKKRDPIERARTRCLAAGIAEAALAAMAEDERAAMDTAWQTVRKAHADAIESTQASN